jgi:hypothetical protein
MHGKSSAQQSALPAHLRRKRLIVAAACAAALLATTVIGKRSAKVTIAPGTVVLDVQASEIEALSYLSGDVVLKAHRIAPAGPLSIETVHAGKMEKCQASPDLSGLLPQLTRAKALRQLTPEKADIEFPVKLGTLQLEDRIKAEPMPPLTVRTRSDRSAIALVYDEVAIETDMAPGVFAKLGTGCSTLRVK